MTRSLKKPTAAVNLVLFLLFVVALWSYEPLNHFREPIHNLTSWLDERIPLIPEFIVPYLTLYPFVLLTIVVVAWRREAVQLRTLLVAGTVTLLVCDLVYLIFQTVMIRPSLAGKHGIFYDAVRWLYESGDKPYNDFPSEHAALTTLCAIAWARLRVKASPYMIFWAGLVFVSTVFVRQHNVVDLLMGFTLAFTVYWCSQRLLEKHPWTVESERSARASSR